MYAGQMKTHEMHECAHVPSTTRTESKKERKKERRRRKHTSKQFVAGYLEIVMSLHQRLSNLAGQPKVFGILLQCSFVDLNGPFRLTEESYQLYSLRTTDITLITG